MSSDPPVDNKPPPRVFISYSHDSAEHCDRVLMLTQQFRRDGIDVELDQFHQDELKHWPRWCEEQLRPENSDWVLCICTPEYKRRIEGRVAADVGKGVFWEGTLIYNNLYDEKGNQRCIPVSLDDNTASDIPAILNGYTRFQLTGFSLDDPQSGYAKLYRLLTRQSTAEKACLGERRKLPALPSRERLTDFADLINQILAGIRDVKSDTGKILSILENRTPPPSTKAHPHNLPPWMPPAYFIGREKEMQALCEGLTAPGNALAVVQPQVVHGEGGLGKTRLAIQVVWVLYLQHQCDMAFVVSASSPAELDTQLAALDAPSLLDLYGGEQPPRELDIRKQNVIHALRERGGRWILVLDAADSEEARRAVNELLTQLAGGRFLVTSRREDWPRTTVRKLPLHLFTIEEARACLRSRYWKSEPPIEEIADFDRVANELGFLPLALALAASYMDSRRIIPARYLIEWQQKHDALLGFTADDVEQGRSLLAAFKLSYDLLSPHATHLLQILAWLAPEPFPRRLVEDSEKMGEILSPGIEGSAGSDATQALAELRTLSLLQLDDESVRVHRLVLKCARATLPKDARAAACAIALEWISSILPDAEYDETNWKLWNRLSPHLDEVIAAANQLKIESEALCPIFGGLGLWLFYQARYSQAEPSLRRALAIDEKSYGVEHPNVAIRLNNLAQLLQDTNQLREAEPLMRRALAIDEKSYGPEHPDVATRLSNLAALLKITNRLAEAEPLMRRALIIRLRFTRNTGHLHPHLKTTLGNYWGILKAMSLGEEEIAQRIAEIGKEVGFDEESFRALLTELSK